MKILILANSLENVQKIKSDIQKIENYHHEHHWTSLQIGDLNSHEVHEVSDLISCEWVDRNGEEGGTTTISWKTDNPNNKLDETSFDLVLIYNRFIDEWTSDRGMFFGSSASLQYPNPPIAIAKSTKYKPYYGA